MPTNLVSLVMQFLTPDLIGRIAAALGLDRRMAEMAVSAAVPALLGGLTKVAATPDGARKLYDTVSQQPPGLPDNLTEKLGSPSQKGLAGSGLNLVSSLLGGSAAQTLTGAISQFAGIDPKAGSSLIGLLAPVVMGALAKEKKTAGLDASGLAALMNSQKGNIQAAVPVGFADLLSGSGLFGTVEGAGGQAARAAGSVAQAAGSSAQRALHGASSTASSAMSSANWLYWAIPAVIALALVWWLFGGQNTSQVAEQARTGTQQAANQAASSAQQAAGRAATAARQAGDQAVTGAISAVDQARARADQAMAALKGLSGSGAEVGTQITSTFDSLKASLSGITDTASAQTALPKLQEAQAQVEKIRGLATQLPAEGRSALGTVIAAALPTINELCDKVLAIPGVAPVLQQSIDGLRANLATLAKTQA